MSERILRVSAVDWSQVITTRERPIEFLLRKGVAVYIKVRRDSEIVYRYFKAPLENVEQHPPASSAASPGTEALVLEGESLAEFGKSQVCVEKEVRHLPYAGFLEEVVFLCVGDAALAEIAVSGSCHVSSFSGSGYLIPNNFEITGRTRGGYAIKRPLQIKAANLVKFEFDRAFIVDRKMRHLMLSRVSPMDTPPPEKLALQVELNENDLYVISTDLEALKQEVQLESELVEYPFNHRERMPGIYWMFQAAYAHNHLNLMPREKVRSWLNDKAPAGTYRYKSIRTATKFVWPDLNRAIGGKGRRDFLLEDLDRWTNRSEYEFTHVSKGLSFILAIADWWADLLERSPGEKNEVLERKLIENGFGGLEVEDLVYLISGSNFPTRRLDQEEAW